MDIMSSMKGLAGGVLIGLSAVMLMAFLGRIAGISGITRGRFWNQARTTAGALPSCSG